MVFLIPKQLHPILFVLYAITACIGQNNPHLSESREQPKPAGKNNPTDDPFSDIILCGLQDKTGTIWFGTTHRGVYRYNGRSFTKFTTRDGLSSNTVWTIVEDKAGTIWFGTADGVCRFNGKNFTTIPISATAAQSSAGKPFAFFQSVAPSAKKAINVSSIVQDKTGNYWFGTLEAGVYHYDGKTVTNFLNNDGRNYHDKRTHQAIKYILEDRTGNIWFCSFNRGGVWRYDGKTFTNFLPEDGLSDDMICCALEDKSGRIWFGTRDHGVCRYDGKVFTRFSEKDGLCLDNISCIFADKAGNLWFGSDIKDGARRGGVCRYDGKSFTRLATKEESLVYSGIRTILEDKSGHIWVGSRGGGLWRYDGKKASSGQAGFTDFSEQLAR